MPSSKVKKEPSAAPQVRAYIAGQPPAARRRLAAMRALIRKAAPDAVEIISYQMPAFKLNGRILVYYAGWAEHTSIYMVTAAMQEVLARAGRTRASKATIKFPLDEPLPSRLITSLVKARVAEMRRPPRHPSSPTGHGR